MHYQGQDDRLERWLGRFREDDFERYPLMTILAAWVHALLGRAEMAERMADIVDRATLDGRPQAERTLAGPSALTPAELRLLPLLSTYLTFDEIGQRLSVTRHTAKAHALAIYGKLGASGRSEAIDRAIEVGLLEPFPGLSPRTGDR